MDAEERLIAGHWYAIGLYAGPSPLALVPVPGVSNPVFSYRDVTDVSAIFVADPFLIRHDARWYLFFEVYNERTDKGEIGVAVSGDARSWAYRGLVLVEDFSVSYPHVFRWHGQFYMVPEMYEQDCVRLYRAESFPYEWRPVATLIKDGPVADPTLFRFDDSWWMFTCPRPLEHDILRLYRSTHLLGPWREHPKSPVISGDRRSARPAGRVVQGERGLVRFAQDCFPKYGTAVRAFEITRLTPEEYVEVAVAKPPISAPDDAGAWNSVRMHHIDAHQLDDGSWLAVIDGHGRPADGGDSQL
jgi:hypothetical protein